MITLDGTIQRKFYFPADPLTTMIYFSDLSRVVYYLPHISLVETYTSNKVRIRYQTVELGAYTINILCDLELKVDADNFIIQIHPLPGCAPVEVDATLNATTGYGYYTSTARLSAEDEGTSIDYRFRFQSKLPRPRGLRMMPKRIVDRIAQSISLGRVEEIAEGFMQGATSAYDAWRAGQDGNLAAQWLSARDQAPAETSAAPKGG